MKEGGHYTYIGELRIGEFSLDDNGQKFATAVLLGLIILLLGYLASRKIRSKQSLDAHIVPPSKFSLTAFFDLLVEVFIKYHDSIL